MDISLLPAIRDFLLSKYPFDQLSLPAIEKIITQVEILYLATGDRLPNEKLVGYGLYLIRTGAVEQRYPQGELRARLGTGDILGFSQLLYESNITSDYEVIAIENSLLYCIPKAILLLTMQEDPAIAHHFASQEGNRIANALQSGSFNQDDMFYLQSIGEIVNTQLACVNPTTSIQMAAQTMVSQHRSSVLIMENDSLLGIVTDRDLTKRVVATGQNISAPVSQIMTTQPITIHHRASILHAIELMMQHNIRSLPVIKNRRVMGVLTATSLVQKSSVQAVYLIRKIYQQETLEDLTRLATQRHVIFKSLVAADIHPRAIQEMVTLIADGFTKRLLQLAEKTLGPPPCQYAWMVAGSQARQEMNFFSDQDNALILAREVVGDEERYFHQLTEYVCHGLAQCGYPLCPGQMMACYPQWRLSLQGWIQRYHQWLLNAEAEALLHISVFLDLRYLYGSADLFQQLLAGITPYLHNNHRILRFLTANSLRVSPPLGMFRQFVLFKNGENRHVFNIKTQAINLIIELARIYGLAAGTLNPNTEQRLHYATQQGVINKATRDELLETLAFINQVRFRYQKASLKEALSTYHHIMPELLTQFERNHLKDAFRIIARTQEAAQLRYHAKGVLQ